MATFKITRTNSVFTTSNEAFELDSPVADTLIIDPDAWLISTMNAGAWLNNTGAWTVTVNGLVISKSGVGIFLHSGNPGVSKITVGAQGEVGGFSGIGLLSPATVANAGEITGTTAAGIYTVNSGTHTINNTGGITGSNFSIQDLGGVGTEKVTNSGTLNGTVDLGGGNDTLTNSGTIQSNLVILGDGTNKLTNTGNIGATVQGGTGADTLVNSGTISGSVSTFGGNDVFTNYITDATGKHSGITNDSIIDMGQGADKFYGGDNAETLRDGGGSDLVKLGGGDDWYHAVSLAGGFSDGTDTVDGGLGVDTYNANGGSGPADTGDPTYINIDTVQHNILPIPNGPIGNGLTAAGTALVFQPDGTFTDKLIGFENVVGSNFFDIIYGNAGANMLDGREGGGVIFGYDGNDTLIGGDQGSDSLVGGAGKDTSYGGAGADPDYFRYLLPSDSSVAKAGRDVIVDFDDTVDLIDVSFIDANTLVAGNQAFQFLGTNVPFSDGVSTSPALLRAIWNANGQLIQGEINGDGVADFSIQVTDPNHVITFGSTDFLL